MADPLHNLRTITARHIRHLPVRVDLLKSANRALNLYQAYCIKFNIDFSSLTPAVKQQVLLLFRPAVGQVDGDIHLDDDEEEERGEAAAAAGLNDDADAVANHRLDFVARVGLLETVYATHQGGLESIRTEVKSIESYGISNSDTTPLL
mgnify:CR=1 FL=1